MNYYQKKSKLSSFTLIELLIVILIIAILGAIIFSATSEARKSARDTQRIQNVKNISQALELYFDDNFQYPEGEIGSLSDDGFCIEQTINDDGSCKSNSFCSYLTQKDSQGKPKYIVSLPKDPLYDKVRCESPYSQNCHCIIYKTKGNQKYKLFAKLEQQSNKLAKEDGGTEDTMYEIASKEKQAAIQEIKYGRPWYFATSWQYRKQITIDHTKVQEDLTDFPVLISITDNDLKTKAQEDGDDILFTDFDGTTKLSHEIEKYESATGKLIAWIKLPTLSSSTDTILYMYYGNPVASNQENKVDVWSSGYVGVWHLSETSGEVPDSTQNGYHGIIKGQVNQNGKIQLHWKNSFVSCSYKKIN